MEDTATFAGPASFSIGDPESSWAHWPGTLGPSPEPPDGVSNGGSNWNLLEN